MPATVCQSACPDQSESHWRKVLGPNPDNDFPIKKATKQWRCCPPAIQARNEAAAYRELSKKPPQLSLTEEWIAMEIAGRFTYFF